MSSSGSDIRKGIEQTWYEYLSKYANLFSSNEIQGSSPPSVFVGSYGYPKVGIGPMLPPIHGDTSLLDAPERWLGKNLDELVNYRLNLVRGIQKTGIEEPVFIHKTAKIGKSVYIGPFTYIGEDVVIGNNVQISSNCHFDKGCKVGENTKIYSGVKFYDKSQIGSNCVFHSGAVIGSDGFGFAPNKENQYQKIIQIGNVIIEDNVEIGSNTVIDRATIGSTIIRKGVKIDNLVQIAHNVEVGENTVIAAQTGVSGSSKIDDNVIIGGQVGIAGHLKISKGTKIAAQSGITKSVLKENSILQGTPAFSSNDFKRSYVLFKNFPELKKQIEDLVKEINKI